MWFSSQLHKAENIPMGELWAVTPSSQKTLHPHRAGNAGSTSLQRPLYTVSLLNMGYMEPATLTRCNWPCVGKKKPEKNQIYVTIATFWGQIFLVLLFCPAHSLKQSILLCLKTSNPSLTSGSSTASSGFHHNQPQTAQNRVNEIRWVKHCEWWSTGYTHAPKKCQIIRITLQKWECVALIPSHLLGKN